MPMNTAVRNMKTKAWRKATKSSMTEISVAAMTDTAVIDVPASPGREKAPVIILQGHLDMVCEKTPDTKHDFMKDPIRLKIVDGFLMAEGTTLGADNGIAVAANMALMADTTVEHGPLEFLFTVDGTKSSTVTDQQVDGTAKVLV